MTFKGASSLLPVGEGTIKEYLLCPTCLQVHCNIPIGIENKWHSGGRSITSCKPALDYLKTTQSAMNNFSEGRYSMPLKSMSPKDSPSPYPGWSLNCSLCYANRKFSTCYSSACKTFQAEFSLCAGLTHPLPAVQV